MKTGGKICFISSVAKARMAIQAGADALGLVSKMPSGPGPISDNLIAKIAASIPPGVDSFLLTSETQPQSVVDHVKRCGTSTIQLVKEVPIETYAALRRDCRGIRIFQVIHVEDKSALAQAQAIEPLVDAILLDSGRPSAAIPELGGTGRTHDWNVSAQIVRKLNIPAFLAGGLNPDNAAEAIKHVAPFGLDLCSGVRKERRLDGELLHRFMRVVAQRAKLS